MAYTKKRPTRKPKKNYKNKTSNKKIASIVKKEINKCGAKPEMKRTDTTYAVVDGVVGQCVGNSNGWYGADITPALSQGNGVSQRIGNRCKIHSAYMTVQLRQMSGASHPTKLKFYLFHDKSSNTDAVSTIVDNLFNYNEYIGGGASIYDYNSTRNMDYISDLTLLRTWTSYIRADSVSSQLNLKTYSLGFKWKKPKELAFFSTASANVSTGKFFLIVMADSGNASTTTASTLTNAPVLAINTGTYINFSMKWYYTDA